MKIAATLNFYLTLAAISNGRKVRNDARGRAVNADRKEEVQFINDLKGVFGELGAIAAAEHAGFSFKHNVLCPNPDGGCDILLEREEGPVKCDAKGVFMMNQSDLLINQRTHLKYKDVGFYIPILGNIGSDCFYVGNHIPHEAIDTWTIADLKDKAYKISLQDLIANYFTESYGEISSTLYNSSCKLINRTQLSKVPALVEVPAKYNKESNLTVKQVTTVVRELLMKGVPA